MKIAIIGTGAMGSLFAALLSPFASVIMVGNWAEQLLAVNSRGLVVRHPDGRSSNHALVATSRAADAAPADIALVLVKGWQTKAAGQLAQAALAPDGLAITLQNGLGNLELLANYVDSLRAIQGVTSEGATLLGPGIVRHAGRGQTYFAADEKTRNQLEQTADVFLQAGLECSVVGDAQGLIWGKLAINAAINPLTALLQVPNGWLLERPLTLDIMGGAAREVQVVAKKLGISLPFDDAAAQAMKVARATAENRSSMAQDIARGTPTEIEQICGAVVRHSRSLDIATPINRALLQLVRAQVRHGAWRDYIEELQADIEPIFHELANMENG